MPPDKTTRIQCQLFDYPIEETGERTCLYEALSYVWGSSDKPHSVSIDGYDLPVTTNLYAALLHLRDKFIERILWVDAICIDQNNLIERAQQVQLMGTIYCKAHRVLVWLGEAIANGDRALNAILIAADEEVAKSSTSETNQQAILDLIQRPWFQRIWVLQEVAAARHILVICGSMEIDGYAFCLGLLSIERFWSDLQNPIRPVTHLIRGSIFRPKYAASLLGVVSLDIHSLGELIDMYHTHKATEPRDKVFALLSMSSDNPRAAGLLPDCKSSPEEIFQKLVRFLLGRHVSVKIWGDMEIAVIKNKGYILGRVSMQTDHSDRQKVEVTLKNTAEYVGKKQEWILQVSAKSIQVGDLVCFLQGVSKPMIVRLCRDYFAVVMIAVTPLTNVGMASVSVRELEQLGTAFLHDLLLVWDWEWPQGELNDREYETLMKSRVSKHSDGEVGGQLDRTTRLWDLALTLEDAEVYGEAKERLREIVEGYENGPGKEDLRTLTCMEKLALMCEKMKQWEEGEKRLKQVIQTRKRVQGTDHPDTTKSMANLASMYRAQGHLEEAEKLEAITRILERKGMTHSP